MVGGGYCFLIGKFQATENMDTQNDGPWKRCHFSSRETDVGHFWISIRQISRVYGSLATLGGATHIGTLELPSLKRTAKKPENRRLEKEILIGNHHF